MSVTLKLNPLLRKYAPDYDHDKGIVLADGSGKRVSRLIQEMNIPEKRVTSVLVNHMPSRTEYVAKDGDLVLLAMLIGGG
jgi:hypothetical protein